jgi:hypothetical protein
MPIIPLPHVIFQLKEIKKFKLKKIMGVAGVGVGQKKKKG